MRRKAQRGRAVLTRHWPVFSWTTCAVCKDEFRRETMYEWRTTAFGEYVFHKICADCCPANPTDRAMYELVYPMPPVPVSSVPDKPTPAPPMPVHTETFVHVHEHDELQLFVAAYDIEANIKNAGLYLTTQA